MDYRETMIVGQWEHENAIPHQFWIGNYGPTQGMPGSSDRGQYWGGLWSKIRKANIILTGVKKYNTPDNPEASGEGDITRRIGETYFLRGYLHLLLVRAYGEIPYLDYLVDPSDDMGGNSYAQQSNSTSQPKAYMVADAHLDTQWNWDVQTTINKYVWNTLNQNLFLLKHYPDYIFNFEGGVKYSWMKEYYPAQYEELKKYIKEGRWHIAGSSWEASDVLVPSVESSIRNILLGQTFYRQEFGKEGTDIFLPDCFGFGWTLPSIASHCGLIGFSSQKLDWREHPFYGDSKHPFMVSITMMIKYCGLVFALKMILF